MYKNILLFTILIFIQISLFPNDFPYGSGNTIFPIDENSIELKYERLHLKNGSNVTVYYEFYNTGEPKIIKVAFAMPYLEENNVLINFNVIVNKETVKTEIVKNANELLDTENSNKKISIITFDAYFKKGKNIIEHFYEFIPGVYYWNTFTNYILTTGNLWANKQIDEFEFVIEMGEDSIFSVNPSFYRSFDSIKWNIIGSGNIDKKTLINNRIYCYIKEGYLYYHEYNFKPELDFEIYWTEKPYETRYAINFKEQSQNNIINEYIIDYLMRLTLNSELLKKMTLEQLRILRNYLFARKGYIFKNKELLDLFSNNIWYVPDSNVKNDVDILYNHEKELFNEILKYEKLLKEKK